MSQPRAMAEESKEAYGLALPSVPKDVVCVAHRMGHAILAFCDKECGTYARNINSTWQKCSFFAYGTIPSYSRVGGMSRAVPSGENGGIQAENRLFSVCNVDTHRRVFPETFQNKMGILSQNVNEMWRKTGGSTGDGGTPKGKIQGEIPYSTSILNIYLEIFYLDRVDMSTQIDD